ncbi:phage tail protein I [Desulfocurvibacter africanus]|uniref:phage tail protein I n=1 Tax=Desulfocurvibacter africanus TaxID=873 RepID=UPI0004250E72|nr:phage tail protein I [Desulfocurvibacter africanus]
MSKILADISLAELLPEPLRRDATYQAAAKSLDAELQAVTTAARSIDVRTRLDELREPLLAHLAAELHADLWDPKWSEAQKRQAIRDALAVHRTKGTPWAVERLLAPLAEVEMQEWFEYGGLPYTFRVLVHSTVTEGRTYEKISQAVNLGKNLRSRFTVIRVPRVSQGTLHIGCGVHMGLRQTIGPAVPSLSARSGKTFIGGAVHMGLRYTIHSQ